MSEHLVPSCWSYLVEAMEPLGVRQGMWIPRRQDLKIAGILTSDPSSYCFWLIEI